MHRRRILRTGLAGGAVSVVFARPKDATSSPANGLQESRAQMPGH